jgi:hypothetical protein
VQATRLGLAVEMLEEFQMPPAVSGDSLPAPQIPGILTRVQALRHAIANAPDPTTFVYPAYLQKGGLVLNPADTPTGVMEERRASNGRPKTANAI